MTFEALVMRLRVVDVDDELIITASDNNKQHKEQRSRIYHNKNGG